MMKRTKGFTLIELMIVVLVISVLAGLAFCGYQKQVRKSRRAEARQVLADVSLRQEKWRSNHVSYLGTDSAAADKTAFGAITASTYYTIAITTTASGTAYTATAVPKGDQLKDTCGTLSWALSAGVVNKTAAASDCW